MSVGLRTNGHQEGGGGSVHLYSLKRSRGGEPMGATCTNPVQLVLVTSTGLADQDLPAFIMLICLLECLLHLTERSARATRAISAGTTYVAE